MKINMQKKDGIRIIDSQNDCCYYLSVAAVPPSYTVARFKTSRSTSGWPQKIVLSSAGENMAKISAGRTAAMPLYTCSRPLECVVRWDWSNRSHTARTRFCASAEEEEEEEEEERTV